MPSTSEKKQPPATALAEAEIGRIAHVVVGELLAAELRQPTPLQVLQLTAGHARVRDYQGSYRQAAKQRLLSAVSLYFRLFVPDRTWSFEGAEVSIGASRLDLLWSQRSGAIRADELKTGRGATTDAEPSLTAQVQAQVAAGVTAYGEKFVGVRALLLASPRRSYLLRADGRTEQILELGS